MLTAHDIALGQYPVSLRLNYKATSRKGPVQGFGKTRMMSSKDIVFAPGDGLEAGMRAKIVLEWPPGLDDDRLQLVLQVTITGIQNGEVEAHILASCFRAAAPVHVQQIARSAGA